MQASLNVVRPPSFTDIQSQTTTMGAGTIAVDAHKAGYAHLLDPNRKWYNNRRSVSVVARLVFATSSYRRLYSSSPALLRSTHGSSYCAFGVERARIPSLREDGSNLIV